MAKRSGEMGKLSVLCYALRRRLGTRLSCDFSIVVYNRRGISQIKSSYSNTYVLIISNTRSWCRMAKENRNEEGEDNDEVDNVGVKKEFT